MKPGWVERKLGDLAKVSAGNSAPQAKALFQGGRHPFFRTADAGRIRFGEIREATDHLNDKGTKGLRLFPKGTILLPKSGASTFLNHRVMLGVDGYVAQHLATVEADREQVDRHYLLYFLSTVAAQTLVQDHAYPSLTLPLIESIPVRLPALPEQRRIVEDLSKSMTALTLARDNILRSHEFVQSLFDSHLAEVFGGRLSTWSEKRLSEVAKDFGRGKSKHRPRNDPRLYGGPYPFIQTGDIRNSNHRISEYTQTYNKVGLAQSKLWPKGTLCVTIAANIAETGILDFDACFPDSVIGVVVDEAQTSSAFLEYLLQSFKARLQAEGKGAAQDNINLRTFEDQTFPFPSRPIQDRIVAELDALRYSTTCLRDLYDSKLALLEELRESLLRRAFSGHH